MTTTQLFIAATIYSVAICYPITVLAIAIAQRLPRR